MSNEDSTTARPSASVRQSENETAFAASLNKPLPPLRYTDATTAPESIVTANPGGFKRPAGSSRQPHEGRSNMSLLHIFSRPKVERSRGSAENGTPTSPQPEYPGLGPSRRDSRADLRGVRLDKASRITGTPNVTSSPRLVDLNRPPRPNPEAFDLHNPPPFRKIFSIAAKIAPAHTCLLNGSKANPTWKVGGASNFDQHERPSSRRSSRMPQQPTPELQRKIFCLTKNGYLLLYADRGRSDRLPERVHSLTKDTCAIACDLVPGRPYTVQVAESTTVQEIPQPDAPSFLSRWGMKNNLAKKQVPSTLIVLDSAEGLEEWLLAIRKEIQRQIKPSTPSTPPRTRTPPAERTLADLTTPRTHAQKASDIPPRTRERADSPRQSFHADIHESLTEQPNYHETEMIDEEELEMPTASQMYHREVMLARKESETASVRSRKRRSLLSPPEADRVAQVINMTSSQASPSTERRAVQSRTQPHTSPVPAKDLTPLRQLQTAEADEPGPVRKDSLMKSPELSFGFADQGEAARLAKARKRASHHGPPAFDRPDRPQLRTVNSLGRLRSDQGSSVSPKTFVASPLSTETYGSPQREASSGRRVVTRKDKDEYHAFQLAMSMEPSAQRSTPSIRTRRHSAIPSETSQSSPTSTNAASSSQPPYAQRIGPIPRASSRDGPAAQQPAQPPVRFPFKLRGGPPQPDFNHAIAYQRQVSPSPAAPVDGMADSYASSHAQKLRRPTSMQVRPNATPFLATIRSTPGNSPPDVHSGSIDREKAALRPSRSDHALPSTARAPFYRPAKRQDAIAENFSDDEDMFIIQGMAVQQRRQSQTQQQQAQKQAERWAPDDAPLPRPDLGMPLVALGPPPPPPEVPLPRLPPPQTMTSPRMTGAAMGH